MGKAKWWVCDDCKSLNDLPANKCFNCRSPRPSNPVKIDDQYSQVGGGTARVGVTVDLSKVGDLTRPDPIEAADGGGIIEAYNFRDDFSEDQPLESYRDTSLEPKAPPPPLREPRLRSIAEAGGRHWEETYSGLRAPPRTEGQPAGSGPPGTPPAGAAPIPPTGPAPGQPPPAPHVPSQPPPSQPPPGQAHPGQVPPGQRPPGSMPPPPQATPPPGPARMAPPGGPRPPAPPGTSPAAPGPGTPPPGAAPAPPWYPPGQTPPAGPPPPGGGPPPAPPPPTGEAPAADDD